MWKRLLLLAAIGSVSGCTRDDEPLEVPVGSVGGFTGSGGFFWGSGGSVSVFGSGGSVTFFGSGGSGIIVPSGTGGGACWGMVIIPDGLAPTDAGKGDAASADTALDGAATEAGAHDSGSAGATTDTDAGAHPDIPPWCRWSFGSNLPSNVDPLAPEVGLGRETGPVMSLPRVTACNVDGGAEGFTYGAYEDPHEVVLCPGACERYVSEGLRVSLHLGCRSRPTGPVP